MATLFEKKKPMKGSLSIGWISQSSEEKVADRNAQQRNKCDTQPRTMCAKFEIYTE